MASHYLSNTKTQNLGATPGAIPGIDGNPHEFQRFLFAPAFSERSFKNWGVPALLESRNIARFGATSSAPLRSQKSRFSRRISWGELPPFSCIQYLTAAFSERFFKNWGGPRAPESKPICFGGGNLPGSLCGFPDGPPNHTHTPQGYEFFVELSRNSAPYTCKRPDLLQSPGTTKLQKCILKSEKRHSGPPPPPEKWTQKSIKIIIRCPQSPFLGS